MGSVLAAGDSTSGLQSVAAGGVLNIQPTGTNEWVIHNVYYGGAVDFNWTDGTNVLKFDSDTAAGARLGSVFHVTSTKWLQIKNTSGGAFLIGYDGVATK